MPSFDLEVRRLNHYNAHHSHYTCESEKDKLQSIDCSPTALVSADPDRVIHTEMMLVPEEFDNYQIGVDTDVTFCLKELRVLRKLIGICLIESKKMNSE